MSTYTAFASQWLKFWLLFMSNNHISWHKFLLTQEITKFHHFICNLPVYWQIKYPYYCSYSYQLLIHYRIDYGQSNGDKGGKTPVCRLNWFLHGSLQFTLKSPTTKICNEITNVGNHKKNFPFLSSEGQGYRRIYRNSIFS